MKKLLRKLHLITYNRHREEIKLLEQLNEAGWAGDIRKGRALARITAIANNAIAHEDGEWRKQEAMILFKTIRKLAMNAQNLRED
jgi:hypothetical protein